MIHALVTGANGFLASHLLDFLCAQNAQITVLLREGTSAFRSKNKSIQVYSDVDELINSHHEFNCVFHLAAVIPSEKVEHGKTVLDTNISLTLKLADAYRDARFIFASSVSVYGIPHSPVLNLNSCFNNPNAYGLSKIAGETIVMYHPDHAIIRFSSIIGCDMNSNTFVPRVIKQSKGGVIELFGKGSRLQNYIDVRDAARLMFTCSLVKGNIRTLGVGAKSYSNTEVAQIVAMKNNSQIKFQGVDASPSFIYDAEDSYNNLSFYPEFTLEQEYFSHDG